MPPACTDRCCQLCFEFEVADSKGPMLSTTVVHKFLDKYATPTPFQYAYLQQVRKKNKLFLICTNCESWLRRQCQSLNSSDPRSTRKRLTAPSVSKTVLLTVDRLILSIMIPGSYAPPEVRITRRHIATIKRNGGCNELATICPPLVVRTICDNELRLRSRTVLKSIVGAAWKSGRRQVVFGSSLFAKAVRSGAPESTP